MKKLHVYIGMIWVVMSLMATSCEKVVSDVALPDVKPQLAVYGFISPEDSDINVQVYLSVPIYNSTASGNGPITVTDANVVITDQNGSSISMPFRSTSQGYMVSQQVYPINPGYTYTITVTSKQYRAKASCTVPVYKATFNQLTATVLADQQNSNYSGPYYRYNYKWNDIGGANNYYRITVDESGSFGNYEIGTLLYDDVNKDGAELSGFIEDTQPGSTGSTIKKTVLVHLLTTDNHYYEYHRRRLNYYGDDPFSEPYPQYSNMEDGLGVFCAFRMVKQTLQVQ